MAIVCVIIYNKKNDDMNFFIANCFYDTISILADLSFVNFWTLTSIGYLTECDVLWHNCV